jgi:hypothetical protein
MCSKFDVKSTKLVFVGYIITSKGYRLWEPNTKKVRKIADVIFDETFTYNSFAPILAHSTKLLQVGSKRTLTLTRVAQLHIIGVVGAMQPPTMGGTQPPTIGAKQLPIIGTSQLQIVGVVTQLHVL